MLAGAPAFGADARKGMFTDRPKLPPEEITVII
jgi:hypothetical protein